MAEANTASAKVAQRLGAVPDGTVQNRYGVATVYRHLQLEEVVAKSD